MLSADSAASVTTLRPMSLTARSMFAVSVLGLVWAVCSPTVVQVGARVVEVVDPHRLPCEAQHPLRESRARYKVQS